MGKKNRRKDPKEIGKVHRLRIARRKRKIEGIVAPRFAFALQR